MTLCSYQDNSRLQPSLLDLMLYIALVSHISNHICKLWCNSGVLLAQMCVNPQDEEEEAEPEKPVKAERPSSRDYANAQKKTNLRSEDDTFKVQEEQRYTMTLGRTYLRNTCQVDTLYG